MSRNAVRERKTFLAVDLGASGGKCFAGVFDESGFSMTEVYRFSHEPVSFHLPDREGVVVERMYWDDIAIYAHIIEGLRNFGREIGDRLDGIGIDAWGADGQFVSPDGDIPGKIYAYRDHRLDGMIDEVKARISPERIFSITGIHFQPFNISNQILWFLQNRRELMPAGGLFVPIPSLFNYYLGGIIKVDSSWASVTQLMDARSKCWSGEVMSALGIPPGIMPEIVEPGSIIGQLHQRIADSVGLNRAALVAVGSHDTACAFAAAPAEDPGESLIISSGTWSLVGKLVPGPVTGPEAMALGLSNEGGIGNTRLLKNCMGGWLVHELRRSWREADGRETEWADVYRLAEAAPAFRGFIDPDDPVFYNPPDMEAAICDYCCRTGQPAPSGRGAILRLVYESLALQYRRINEDICSASGRRTRVVHIVGGGARNELLNRFTADALGIPVVAGPVEATAAGNIMTQAVALGLLGSMSDAMPVIGQAFPIKKYEPQNVDAWNKANDQFRKCTAS